MMLEVKNLCKTYNIKGQQPIKALDNVSLKFPDKGLVFILGKSGSGKSTLLNVMGGLDKADSGEIIINNKSSKDFNGSEMDSYRNTYLGFIFQEYNILNDFSVRDNIALALQLQQKKVTKETIDSILTEVDLKGMEKRKPNQISGGQKQRVAIARALVKDPQIIFGDEPTGALDSNTGKMVFETLKKLSKTRLVVIVSHDRDFAERFGDRVIELKDGQVISDITKELTDAKELSDGVNILANGLIRIDKGHKLTSADLEAINEKLEASENDAYLSIDKRVNEAIGETAMIDESGKIQSFKNTIQDEVEIGDGEFKVVKSKFPMHSAFTMGAKSLRVKPIRLMFTIILSIVAFTLFGLAATLAQVNKYNLTTNSILNSDLDLAYLSKSTGFYSTPRKMSTDEIKEIENKVGMTFDYTIPISNSSINFYQSTDYSGYYATQINAMFKGTDEILSKYNLSLVSGNLPASENEICIPLDLYNSFVKMGYRDYESDVSIKPEEMSYEQIIGNTLSLDNVKYKIKGIIDTHLDLSPYEKLKDDKSDDSTYKLREKLSTLRKSGFHSMVFGASSLFEDESIEGKVNEIDIYTNKAVLADYSDLDDGEKDKATTYSCKIVVPSSSTTLYFNKNQTSLSSGETVLNINQLFKNSYSDFDMTGKNIDITYGLSNEQISFTYSYGTRYISIPSFENFYSYYSMSELLRYLASIEYANQNYQSFYEETNGTGKYSSFLSNNYSYYYNYSTHTYNSYLDENTKYEICQSFASNYYNVNDYAFAEYNEGLINQLSSTLKKIITSYSQFNYSSYYGIVDANKFIYTANYMNQNTIEFNNTNYYTYSNKISSYNSNETTIDFYKTIVNLLNDYNNQDILTFDTDQTKTYTLETLNNDSKQTRTKRDISYKVVGISFDMNDGYSSGKFYLSEDDATTLFGNTIKAKYGSLIAPMPKDKKTVSKLVELYYDSYDLYNAEKADTFYLLSNNVTEGLQLIVSFVSTGSKIFLYIGIGFAVFSILLFYNYVSLSIANKRREIGILRAVGARGFDVFKIFFSEAFIISMINFFISIISVFIISIELNKSLAENLSFAMTILSPGIITIALVLGVSLFAGFISSFLPVTRIAHQRPIDAIRGK